MYFIGQRLTCAFIQNITLHTMPLKLDEEMTLKIKSMKILNCMMKFKKYKN